MSRADATPNVDVVRAGVGADTAFGSVMPPLYLSSNYLFEDIRIENANWRLFYITLAKHEFADRANKMGQISDLTFRNITATGSFQRKNVIKGWDADHKVFNVTFENLKINGRYVRNADDGNFEIDLETTDNIVFKVGAPHKTKTLIPE